MKLETRNLKLGIAETGGTGTREVLKFESAKVLKFLGRETGSTFANTPSAYAKASAYATTTADKTADKPADKNLKLEETAR